METIKGVDNQGNIRLACCKLGQLEFAIDVMAIKEIMRYQRVTPVPKAPPFIEGIINLRGMVIPIVDLRKRFSLPSELHSKTRTVIAKVWDRIFGFVVDGVTTTIEVAGDTILPAPKMASHLPEDKRAGLDPEYLDGVVERGDELLLILNLDRLLSSEERLILEGPRVKAKGKKVKVK